MCEESAAVAAADRHDLTPDARLKPGANQAETAAIEKELADLKAEIADRTSKNLLDAYVNHTAVSYPLGITGVADAAGAAAGGERVRDATVRLAAVKQETPVKEEKGEAEAGGVVDEAAVGQV